MAERKDFIGLVVEDEWLLRVELVEELVQAGWRILEAANGEDALAEIEKVSHLDFLVTDIRLPGAIDGWTVAEQARVRFSLLPVIYVTANPVNDARRVNGSVFLGKPVEVRLLLEACDRLILGGG